MRLSPEEQRQLKEYIKEIVGILYNVEIGSDISDMTEEMKQESTLIGLSFMGQPYPPVYTPEPLSDPSEELIRYARENNLDKVRELYSKGFDLDTKSRLYHQTALMYAVKNDNAEMVRFLLDNNADKMVVDRNENNIFHYIATCCKNPTSSIISLLDSYYSSEELGKLLLTSNKGSPLGV